MSQDSAYLSAYPRLRHVRPLEVRLSAGDCLFIPALWWHEVVTVPECQQLETISASSGDAGEVVAAAAVGGGGGVSDDVSAEQPLTVSVNLWFDTPTSALAGRPRGAMRLELARQLESLLASSLGSARLVAPFLRALSNVWRQAQERQLQGTDEAQLWSEFHAMRPDGDDHSLGDGCAACGSKGCKACMEPARRWQALAQYVSARSILALGARKVLPWLDDLMDPMRFECVPNALEA